MSNDGLVGLGVPGIMSTRRVGGLESSELPSILLDGGSVDARENSEDELST